MDALLLQRAPRRSSGYEEDVHSHEALYAWKELLQGLTAISSWCSVRVREGDAGSGWWREVKGVELVEDKRTSDAGHEEEVEEEEEALVVVVGDTGGRRTDCMYVEDWCSISTRPIVKKLVVVCAETSTTRRLRTSRGGGGASTVAVHDCASLSRLMQRESLRARSTTGLATNPTLVCVALSPRRRANYLGRGMMPLLFGDGGVSGSGTNEDDACIAYAMVGVDGEGIDEAAVAMNACDIVVMHRPIDGLERAPSPFLSSALASADERGAGAAAAEGTGSASTIGDVRWQFAAATTTLEERINRLAECREIPIFLLDIPHLVWQLLDRERIATMLRDMPRFTSGSACVRGASSVRVETFGNSALTAALDAGLALQRPVIMKPLLAAGSCESHTMSIVEAVDALATISAASVAADTPAAELHCPLLIQEFVPHNGVVYKVYAIGDDMHLAVRQSVGEMSVDASSTASIVSASRDVGEARDTQKYTLEAGAFERRWQVTTFNSQQPLPAIHLNIAPKRRQPEDNTASIDVGGKPRHDRLPDVAILRQALSWIRSRTQLSVLGMDVLIDAATGEHVIVDVNSMPSFGDVDAANAGASLSRLFVSTVAARRAQPVWELVGEGAANVVVRRRQCVVGSNIDDDIWQGKVLRLRKLFDDERNRITVREDDDTDAAAQVDAAIWSRYGVDGDSAAARAHSFATHVLIPSVCAARKASAAAANRGVDIVVEAGELLELPRDEIACIERDICTMSRYGPKRFHKLCSLGLRLTDWTLIQSRVGTSRAGVGTVCVELKPKGALLPSAGTYNDHLCFDLVDDMKKSVLKHTLMANYKNKTTTYDPMTLFANDDVIRRRALDALIATPNNNLRISVDGHCVFPDAQSTTRAGRSEERLSGRDRLRDALHAADITVAKEGKCVVDALIDSVVHALRESAVLEWLIGLQHLDRIDTVGAAALYKDMLDATDERTSEDAVPDVPHIRDLSTGEKARLLSDWLIALWASDASIMLSFGGTLEETSARVAVVDIDVKPSKKAVDNFVLEKRAIEFVRRQRTGSTSPPSPPPPRTPPLLDTAVTHLRQ